MNKVAGKATITKVARRYEIRLWEGLGWSKVRYANSASAAKTEAERIETRWASYVAGLHARNAKEENR